MPNRCGIIHVRGPMPPNRISHGEGESPLPILVRAPSCLWPWFCSGSTALHPLLQSPPPGSFLQPAPVCTPTIVLEWQKTFEEKLTPLLSVRESLSEEEAQKMGRKDPEQEVEKFVTSNTQELGKDKWLCPLSGKKFKVCDDNCVVRTVGREG